MYLGFFLEETMKEFLEGDVSLRFDRDRGLIIDLDDRWSGDSLVNISVSPEHLAAVMSGLGNQNCQYQLWDNNIKNKGLVRHTARTFIPLDYKTESNPEAVLRIAKELGLLQEGGWELQSDGLRTQQPKRFEGLHEIILKRYLPVTEEDKKERY